MTFGLRNASSVFQHAMNRDLHTLKQRYPDHFANFMDDVAIATDDSNEGRALHCKIVHKFLDCLEKHSYFLKVSKCQFKQPSIDFLGYVVNDGIACIDPTKISGLCNWPRTLKSVKEV
jgi:Reverse transcriptase (RNA-dependent DNA polymerase)